MQKALIIGVGPNRGLGAQLCKRFAKEGLHVVAAGRTSASLDAVVADIQGAGGEASSFVADATKEADVAALFSHAGPDVDLARRGLWNDRSWRKAAIPNVGCVGMAEDGICCSKGHQRGAGERWITWDFENRSHRATRDAARRRTREGRGRPAKGTRATAASGRQGAKRLGCCSSEARKERCGHPSPDPKLSRKGRGPKSHIGRRRRLRWKQRCDGRLKCVSPARP